MVRNRPRVAAACLHLRTFSIKHCALACDLTSLTLPSPLPPPTPEGDVKIAQSNAIFRYLAKKAGLLGDTDAEFAMSEMLIEEGVDLFGMMGKAHYSEDKAKGFNDLFAADGPAAKHMACLDRLPLASLCEGERRVAGAIYLAATLDMLVNLEPTVLDASPNVKAFFESTVALPAFGNGIRDLSPYFTRE